ncbi:MAG: DUF1343 domain-containing protein [Bacteroidota bacterium]|nr:DUF1343 domain-containing protein [Bacteroidota bacterium]
MAILKIETGAEQVNNYLSYLKNKRVAIVANHTSKINRTHLVDSLLSLDVDVKKVFCPEHGFRGNGDAGEYIKDYYDTKSGLKIISLYGKNKKPKSTDLSDVDIVIFDIQDVGVRIYTYISTMHYVMEACAENNVEFLVLDRPNPNGFYVDGPILDTSFKSFVGMHHVPLVHGMTIAEYARMIKGQKWLKDSLDVKLKYITCKNYSHDSLYKLPVRPSPNLQNMTAVYLYPSLGLFEGTKINVGRGTDLPFEVFGHPKLKNANFEYIPKSIVGVSKYPKHKNINCKGINLSRIDIDSLNSLKRINLNYLFFAYKNIDNTEDFFKPFFYNISGSKILMKQIKNNISEKEIRESWQNDIEKFKVIRKKYLLYPDFKE